MGWALCGPSIYCLKKLSKRRGTRLKGESSGRGGEAEIVFFQAEDGIRELVRSRGLGDVYKKQEVRSWLGVWPKFWI